MHAQLLALRDVELEEALRYLPAAGRILELGAGNGWQARRLADAGYVVLALDVDAANPVLGEHHHVALFDGVHLPLADHSVDGVFSSNVLEHVRDLPGLLSETRRVLRPGGRAVHVLPSPVWRAWTTAARYPFLLQLVTGRREVPSGLSVSASRQSVRTLRAALSLLRRALIEPAHGEFRSSWREVFAYRADRWTARFTSAGWRVDRVEPAGVFYTGYGILPRLKIRGRQRLSKTLGSSGTIFVLTPAAAARSAPESVPAPTDVVA
jgi:SAM-dependent methyltransferase